MLQDNENMNFENEPSPDNTVGETDSAQNTESTPENDSVTENERAQSPFFGAEAPYTAEYVPLGYTEKTYREKKEIRKTATLLGIAFICTTVIMYVWQYVYLLIMHALGYSSYTAVAVLQDSAVLEIIQIILSLSAFMIPFTLVAKVAKLRISDLIPLGKPKKGTVLPFTLIGIGFCAFANIAISQASFILEQLGFEYHLSRSDPPTGFFGFILTIISTAIIPAFVEEYGCRGITFGMLEKYGQGFALMVSSVLFGVMHGNFRQIPFAFLIGLILGFIRIRTGSVWVCFLVHFWNNLISAIMAGIDGIIPTEQINIAYTIYLVIAMIGAIIGILLITKRAGDVYTLEKPECEATEKQKTVWFFTSIVIIAFIAMEFSRSIMYFFE